MGALIVSSIGGPAGFDSLTQIGCDSAAINAGLASAGIILGTGKMQGHHTIPVYLCGAKSQELAYIDSYTHNSKIHAELYAGNLALSMVVKPLVNRYLKKPSKEGRKIDDPIVLLTKKRMGRDVLINFLRYFYQVHEYDALPNLNPNPKKSAKYKTLGHVFEHEAPRFIGGITSHPTCKQTSKKKR